ncbi:MAG: hypothetical protein MPJ79_04930 [Alphaproteobacteria bacterium]|nr:hypothetical protein [Alphaproteobacteria bacterium]
MSDIRIPGGDAGASAAIGLGAVSGSGAVHGKKVGEHPAPPPPPPLSGAEGARPLMGSKMTPDQLEAAKAALTELMSDGNELQAVLTNAILMILQSLFLLRETQDTADVIEINTQVSEMKTAASKIDDEAAWTIAGAAVSGSFKVGASIGSLGAGMKAARNSSRAGGDINQQLGVYNANMNRINAGSGIANAFGDTTGGTFAGVGKESEAESKRSEAMSQQAGGREQRDAKAEEQMRQFIQSVLQTLSQILEAEHQTKTKANA